MFPCGVAPSSGPARASVRWMLIVATPKLAVASHGPILHRALSHMPARRRSDPDRRDGGENGPGHRLRSARPLVPASLSGAVARNLQPEHRRRNSRLFVGLTVVSALAFYFWHSQTVPVTGRRRFNFLSDKMTATLHERLVRKELGRYAAHILPSWDPRTRVVSKIMKRLIPVSGMAGEDWEVYVIADDRKANAAVLPGNKVLVYSGLINVCTNEDMLAAVLGHEIAHNTASHAAERLSAAWVLNLTVGSALFLAGWRGLALFGAWTLAGGLYLQELLFNLPMGRKQETEADYIGLVMMAEACYDPRQAVPFWRRMEHLETVGGIAVPEVLSTHPSSHNRITKIQEWMSEAMEKRQQSDCKGTSAFADRFRQALRRGQLVAVPAGS